MPVAKHTDVPVFLLNVRVHIRQSLLAGVWERFSLFTHITIAEVKMPAKWCNYDEKHPQSLCKDQKAFCIFT